MYSYKYKGLIHIIASLIQGSWISSHLIIRRREQAISIYKDYIDINSPGKKFNIRTFRRLHLFCENCLQLLAAIEGL